MRRFCFAPLAVSRPLVPHAPPQRRGLLGPLVYSHRCLLAPSSLSPFNMHTRTRRVASVYNTSRVCFTASLTYKHGSSSHQLRPFTDLYVSYNEGGERETCGAQGGTIMDFYTGVYCADVYNPLFRKNFKHQIAAAMFIIVVFLFFFKKKSLSFVLFCFFCLLFVMFVFDVYKQN